MPPAYGNSVWVRAKSPTNRSAQERPGDRLSQVVCDSERVRDGSLRWKGGLFEMAMDGGVCKLSEKPHHVRIEPDGRFSIGPRVERQESGDSPATSF
jgi:hypothetical protein